MLRNLFGNLFRHDFEILIFAALLVLGAMCLTIASESGGDGSGAGGSGDGSGAGGSGAGGSGDGGSGDGAAAPPL